MKQSYFLKKTLVAFLILFSCSVIAQTIRGKVVGNDGESLPFINVIEKGTTNGTTTDENGEFSLNVNQLPATVVVSSIGFESLERKVTSGDYFTVTLSEDSVSLDEIVLVGSRNKSRTAVDTPVPVDVIDVTELATAGPQVNLNQILNYVAPSFSSNTQTISDGTDHIDPASLRGLGPDQVLVLVNGKRRHTSSLVNVNGTFGRGSVGTDLNAIPAAAIKRIEVLRDGAAAQYGSDAIAGVINIVLNDSTDELKLSVTTGANVSKYAEEQQGGIDGETVNVSANYGIKLGENGGFINFSGDFDYRNPYSRMREFEGEIFNAYNSIERVANNSGLDLANLSLSDIQFAAQGVTHFDATTQNEIANATSIEQLQGILAFDTTEAELIARGQTRSDYNMRVGQSQVRSGRFFANLELPLDDNGTELYAFSGISARNGNSAGFYRLPNQSRTYTPLYINGFLPEINSKISDRSIGAGIRGKIGTWDVDFSNTWGRNSFDYEITNTSNASQLSDSGTTFDAGGFSFAQNTTNLDFSNNYEKIFNGLNVAFGLEYRVENYDITAGEEASYSTYDANGNNINLLGGSPSTDFFGNSRPGGAQVFPGFQPGNEVAADRNSIATYVDVEADFTEKFMVGGALRFENYSDFGSTLNWKLVSRYKITDDFSVRAAASTGFRAPSLHQLNFSSTSTIFDQNGDPQEVLTAPNDSQLAQDFGIPQLKQEESASVSVGFTAKLPEANLTFTVDGYFVAIEDRVVYTGQFQGPGTGSDIDQALADANASRVAFFANAIDTESKGLDVVVTHKYRFGDNATLKSDLSATFSQTRKVDDIHSSAQIVEAGLEETYFPEDSRIYLEESVPRTKINLTNNLNLDRFNIFLRNVYFGSVTEATTDIDRQQEFGGKLVTDLSLGFNATEDLTFTVGANNLFDIYPDRAADTFSDGGSNRSSGRFDWSRRSQQFGIGGRFLFARLSYTLK